MFKSVKTNKSNVDAAEVFFLMLSARWLIKAANLWISLEFPYPVTSYSRPSRSILTDSGEPAESAFNSTLLPDSCSFS